MRQAAFDYLSLGGMASSGPISLLSGLNPSPSVLVMHFFMVGAGCPCLHACVCICVHTCMLMYGSHVLSPLTPYLSPSPSGGPVWGGTPTPSPPHAAWPVDGHAPAAWCFTDHPAHHLPGEAGRQASAPHVPPSSGIPRVGQKPHHMNAQPYTIVPHLHSDWGAVGTSQLRTLPGSRIALNRLYVCLSH